MQAEQLFQFLRSQKLRLTEQRRGLVKVLSASPLPLSVSGIRTGMKKIGVEANKTTIYRELERWDRFGLVEKTQLSEAEVSYELKRSHHHHLVCLRCQGVENVVIDERKMKKEEERAQQEKNFFTLRHSLEFFGLCKQCRF